LNRNARTGIVGTEQFVEFLPNDQVGSNVTIWLVPVRWQQTAGWPMSAADAHAWIYQQKAQAVIVNGSDAA